MIIGLSGKARSGKDTVGGILVRNHGFTKFSFADALREMALEINPRVFGETHLVSLIAEGGWEKAKEYPEVRRLLQQIGVSVRRLDEDFWMRIVSEKLATVENAVITDVRFLNEYWMVVMGGGEVWRVERPGAGLEGSAALHSSETELDDQLFDATILNDFTINRLEDRVLGLVHDKVPAVR